MGGEAPRRHSRCLGPGVPAAGVPGSGSPAVAQMGVPEDIRTGFSCSSGGRQVEPVISGDSSAGSFALTAERRSPSGRDAGQLPDRARAGDLPLLPPPPQESGHARVEGSRGQVLAEFHAVPPHDSVWLPLTHAVPTPAAAGTGPSALAHLSRPSAFPLALVPTPLCPLSAPGPPRAPAATPGCGRTGGRDGSPLPAATWKRPQAPLHLSDQRSA